VDVVAERGHDLDLRVGVMESYGCPASHGRRGSRRSLAW
jgi:hypothetical protein